MPTSDGNDGLHEAAEQWKQLMDLNRLLVNRSSADTDPGEGRGLLPTPIFGAPPAVPSVAAEIEHAREQFRAFTVEAGALEARLDKGQAVAPGEIGAALDNARAWVEYLGPAGPLRRGFPPLTAARVYVDALARIGELQRVAQQWFDYLAPLWERISTAPQAQARAEAECLDQVTRAEQLFNERRYAFTLGSGNMTPEQVEGRIREMQDLLASVQTLATGTAGACQQRSAYLVSRIQSSLRDEFQLTLNSRRAWVNYQRQQGWVDPGGGPGSGRPGPGSPEWYQGISGMNCYWCRWSLTGLPTPVVLCPNCGRFPQPHG